MFCALSQKSFTLFWIYVSLRKFSGSKGQKWHQNFSRPRGSGVIDQNAQNIVLINNSSTVWPTQILICHFWVSQTICFRMLVIFFITVLIGDKTCSISVWDAVPLWAKTVTPTCHDKYYKMCYLLSKQQRCGIRNKIFYNCFQQKLFTAYQLSNMGKSLSNMENIK